MFEMQKLCVFGEIGTELVCTVYLKSVLQSIKHFIHSFSSLSYDRSKASSKSISPHRAIQSFLLQMRVSCPFLNPLTPSDHYSGRTAPLTSKRCILYIYSTNIGTEYFKHGIYTPFFFSLFKNAVCFIILTYLVYVLFTFYIQDVLKFKKIIPAPKG